MSLSKYPKEIDIFKNKVDAEYEDDINGDIVYADDVNYLQDSIHAIEKTLGVNPQGDNTSISARLDNVSGEEDSVTSKNFYYKSNLSSLNNKKTEEAIIKEINKFKSFTIKEEFITTNENKEYYISLLNKCTSIILISISPSNLTLEIFRDKLNKIKNAGFNKLLISSFELSTSLNRTKQNEIISILKELEIEATYEVTNLSKSISNEYDAYNNPNSVLLDIDERDKFLINKETILKDKIVNSKNLNVFNVMQKTNTFYFLSKNIKDPYLSLVLGIKDIFYTNSEENKTVDALNIKLTSKIKTGSNVIYSEDTLYQEDNTNSYSISKDVSSFSRDKETKILFNDILIEENSIDGSLLKEGTLNFDKFNKENSGNSIIELINNPSNTEKIKKTSIEGLESGVDEEKIKDIVKDNIINAINNSSESEKISSAIIGDLTAGHIQSIVVDAINANIGNAVIDSAVIGEITADKIKSNVIEAINIYAKNMTSESATIDTALIKNLSADKITSGQIKAEVLNANVVNALNLYAKNMTSESAYVDTAIIKELSANKITSGEIKAELITSSVIKAINLSGEQGDIKNLNADNITSGNISADRIKTNVINAINLYASNITATDALISNAVIDSLNVSHIKASVIDAINANIGLADINGAIIKEATISSAKIISGEMGKAFIEDLKADTAQIIIAEIKNSFVGTAQIGTAQIADGAITNALINSLTADKINSGTINTSKITIEGDKGLLFIKDNRIQIFDGNQDLNNKVERVAIGDVNNDGTAYGLRVRGKDGKTVLYDENGVYNEGITDGAITNPKIEDNAIDTRVIKANSIIAEHIVAGSISADKIAANTIVAGSAIIADSAITSAKIATAAITSAKINDAAITTAKIADASITNAKIKDLSADKITAGKIKAAYVEIGDSTTYQTGYNPYILDSTIRTNLNLKSQLPTSIVMSSDGITASMTGDATKYARLDHRGLYIQGGAIQIVGGLSKSNISTDVTNQIDKTESNLNSILEDGIISPFEKIIISDNYNNAIAMYEQALSIIAKYDRKKYTVLDTKIINMDTNKNNLKIKVDSILSNMNVDTLDSSKNLNTMFNSLYNSIKEVNVEVSNINLQSLDEVKLEFDLDYYNVIINSSNGNIFKNGNISTVLTAIVYKNEVDITDSITKSQLIWTRKSDNTTEDNTWNTNHSSGDKAITLTVSDVTNKATFSVKLSV